MSYQAILRFPALLGLALLFIVAAVAMFWPARATARPAAQSGDLSVVKTVQTDADPINGAIVYNGDRITYTLTIDNLTGGTITIDQVLDNLPSGVLSAVQCATATPGTNCSVGPSAVTWGGFQIAGGATAVLRFTAYVGCMASGSSILNQATVTYGSSLQPSNEVVSLAQIKPVVLNATGRPMLDGPSGCSTESGGYDQDWGDYDQDGDLDLALATATQLTVYRNDNGQLVALTSYPHRTFGVRWGDIDNDGQLELIAVGDFTTTASGLRRGLNYIFDNGIFHNPQRTFMTTDVLWRIDLADYDQDGKLDLAGASYIDPANRSKHNLCLLRLYQNPGSGNFNPQECLIGPLTKDTVWEPTLTQRSFTVAWADVDSNGTLDLSVGDYGTANRLHAGNGTTIGAASSSILTQVDPTTSQAWFDVNGDGRLDVLFGNNAQPARLYRNDGGALPAITWNLLWNGPSEATNSVATGSIGSNFHVAFGNYGQPNRLYQRSSGTLTGPAWSSADSANTTGLAWVDYNQDGYIDLTAANYNQNAVGYPSNGATLNTNPVILTLSTGPARSLAWADWDLDGDADLALGNDGQAVQVFRNTGSLPMLNAAWTAPLTESTQSVAWADVDDDLYPDLMVGNSGSANKLYQNDDGVIDSTPFWTAAGAFSTRQVAWGDVDGDGDLDLAVANDGQRNALYLNRRFFRTAGGVSPLGSINDLAWGDYNRDGYPELAIGGVDLEAPGGGFVYLVKNSAGSLAFTKNGAISIDQDASNTSLSDLAWGDYNRDGYLDLAGTFPNQQELRFYLNLNGSGSWNIAQILNGVTAYALDWVDIQRDGWLDLALTNSPGGGNGSLRVYPNRVDSSGANNFLFNDFISVFLTDGIIASVRGIDRDNDGDLDLSVVNQQGPSQQFTTFGSFLNSRLAENAVATFQASSVAWGDYNGDGRLDLLYGGAGVATRLYRNSGANFCLAGSNPVSCPAGPTFDSGGRRTAIFGDFDANGNLDIADGVPGGQVKLYRGGSTQSINSVEAYALAFGDADGDGLLDLLIGGKDGAARQSYVYLNKRVAPFLDSTSTRWPLPTQEATVSVAWADFNHDNHLDFALGNCHTNLSNSVQLYKNNRDNTFSLVTNANLPAFGYCTRSVAWADYDGDGDPDLALGNDGAPSFIYQNQGNFSGVFAQVWSSQDSANTHSLAWGDWNNDGKPDLALGNHGQQARVYANFSTPASTILIWLWQSAIAYNITGLAWGDKDGDGDLDLAFSQDGSDSNGIFENGYLLPGHLGQRYAPLPRNPSYLKIERPATKDAYFISSKVLTNTVLNLDYTVFDPESSSIITSPSPSAYKFEFSINGGDEWQSATISSTTHNGTTSPTGTPARLTWDATADGTIGDYIQFRITVVNNKPAGPIQYAISRAVSPPFRLRTISCVWPADPTITTKVNGVVTTTVAVSQTMNFAAGISAGTGVMTFTWHFGNGDTGIGQNNVPYAYALAGVYPITLTVVGQPCPTTREVQTNTLVTVLGTGSPPLPPGTSLSVYLPLVVKAGVQSTRVAYDPSMPKPGQVTGLSGWIQDDQTILEWTPRPAEEAVVEYWIYRSPRTGLVSFDLSGSVPAKANSFADLTAACGYMYYVTALNAGGESLPSVTSYISQPCN